MVRNPSLHQRRQRGAAGHNDLGALLSQRLRMSKQGFSGFPPCTTEDQIKAPPTNILNI